MRSRLAVAMKLPKWFKPELTLGSLIGGFVTLIAVPYFKWVTLAIFTMQADISVIKATLIPQGGSAFPIRQNENVVNNQGK